MEAGDKNDQQTHALRQQIMQKPSNNPRHPSGLPFIRITVGENSLLVTDMRAEVDLEQLANEITTYQEFKIKQVELDTIQVNVTGDLQQHKIAIAHHLRGTLPGFPGIEFVRDDGSAYTGLLQGAPLSARNIVASFEISQLAMLSYSDTQQLSFNNLHGYKPTTVQTGDDEPFEFALEDMDGNQLSISATRGTTAQELRCMIAAKKGVPVKDIRLHVLGKCLIDQKRVRPQLFSDDETIFYSFGYVEVELEQVSLTFQNLPANALPHVPLGYLWIRKENAWQLMRNSMFPTVPVQLFSYDINGKTSYNTWWLHQHHFTFFYTKDNNKPRRKYPTLNFGSKNNSKITFMRGHLIDLVDGTNATTLSIHNYIPEEGKEWGEHVRNYLVAEARRNGWSVAEWDLYNGKEEKTLDNTSVPTGRILMIFDAHATLEHAYFVPASFNDNKYQELVHWQKQAEEEVAKSKKTTAYKFVASCLQIDINLCITPLVSVNGFKTQLIQDLTRLMCLTELQTSLLLKLGNASPLVEKALQERLISADSVQEHLLPAIKTNLMTNPGATAVFELREIILNLLWIDFDEAWSVYHLMALQGEWAPIALAHLPGDVREEWNQRCVSLNKEVQPVSEEEEDYDDYEDYNEDYSEDYSPDD